ncbi:heme ABC exporter ATP-binding protein CcmA [Altererythrobacter sp. FM1]|uniref:heme ABC exporter ATP-binding protein CcmA n=1 Tax=Tsuneonella flava TaxID=2055955 RepID=UPI000C80892A|nr:heme ABC exporter ATP-binding protein CcmA [Tsuneonella flava]ROT93381.1 heme ABC exporter ATP-binding protein CcmA [Altererythrobacter sp. FM1]
MQASLAATDIACRRGDRLLFRGLSFALGAGEAMQVLGANGTGKTSLLRILAGLLAPYAGSVSASELPALLDGRLPLDEHLPLGEALAFWNRIDDGAIAPEVLAMHGLDTLLDVPVRYLSTGQRKRAAIVQSNARQAPIWLLDEPLNGLDIHAGERLQGAVAHYCAQGGIAVIASHQPFAVPDLRTLDLTEFAV